MNLSFLQIVFILAIPTLEIRIKYFIQSNKKPWEKKEDRFFFKLTSDKNNLEYIPSLSFIMYKV